MRLAFRRPRSPFWWLARALLLGTVGLLAFALYSWQAALNWLGSCLIRDDKLEKADLVLVMGGDFFGPRVLKAAEIGAQGWAPLVLISGPPYSGHPEGESAIDFLLKRGYPREMFAVFGHREPSTLGEVLALRGELGRRGVRRLIVVTSSFHTKRCQILFRLFCPGIHVMLAPASDAHYHANQWWKDASSREIFFGEWEKILGSVLIAYPTHWLTHSN